MQLGVTAQAILRFGAEIELFAGDTDGGQKTEQNSYEGSMLSLHDRLYRLAELLT
jgi:hypothetical protein